MIWLSAVLVLIMRPAATALTTRHPDHTELLIDLHFGEDGGVRIAGIGGEGFEAGDFSCSMRSTPPCRIASAINTARLASCLLTILPCASLTSSSLIPLSGESGIFFASARAAGAAFGALAYVVVRELAAFFAVAAVAPRWRVVSAWPRGRSPAA
jgi:hypothetical protein